MQAHRHLLRVAHTECVHAQGDKDESRSDLEGEHVSADKLDGPKFKFWVTDRQKKKLDYARATALLYTLNLVFGTESGTLLRSPMVQHT